MKIYILILILGFIMISESTFASSLTLENVFNNIALDDTNDVNVYTDYITDSGDSYWNITATGISSATFIIELAGYKNTTTFGIYDQSNNANTIELFSGTDTTSDKVVVSINADGSVVVVDITDPGNFAIGSFSSTTFGYYINVAATGNTYYSDTELNSDGFDHMLAYQGVGEMVDIDLAGPVNAGVWTDNEYILAFEDLYGGGDKDFADLVVMVESVQPVPEPATMILLGSGLLGLASLKRKKNK